MDPVRDSARDERDGGGGNEQLLCRVDDRHPPTGVGTFKLRMLRCLFPSTLNLVLATGGPRHGGVVLLIGLPREIAQVTSSFITAQFPRLLGGIQVGPTLRTVPDSILGPMNRTYIL